MRFVPADVRVAERMTPRACSSFTSDPFRLQMPSSVMSAQKIKKLPLVNPDGTLLGLITAKDLVNHQPASRLRPGTIMAACASVRPLARPAITSSERRRWCAPALMSLVIDIAHGHSRGDGAGARGSQEARSDAVDLVAGNVATAEGATIPPGPRRQRDQGRHRAGRRLRHPADDELRHSPGRGARAVPARRRRSGAADCGWRRQTRRQHRRGACSSAAIA